MKKSQQIVLSAVMLAAISSCSNNRDEWTDGKDASGHTRDTAIYRNGAYHHYRYYGAGWYLLSRGNMINTRAYMPASSRDIGSPSFAPRMSSGAIRTGGFGRSAHFSSGS